MEVKQFKDSEEGPKGITEQTTEGVTGSTSIQGHLLIIDSVKEKFCPKCGNYYRDDFMIMCPHCNMSLNFTESYKVERQCSKCDYVVQAPPSYFIKDPTLSICPYCKEGRLEVKEIYREAPSFSIDGKFNGAKRGKMIREKNEQLKKKHAGYSYETPKSISERTLEKYKKRKEQ